LWRKFIEICGENLLKFVFIEKFVIDVIVEEIFNFLKGLK